MNFKDLKVWQKSRALNLAVYQVTKIFPKEELFGLVSQMRRCSVSISSNIVEGKGRESINEFIQFLRIAKGSTTELENQLILCEDAGLITTKVSEKLRNDSIEIQKMLTSLMKKTKT